MDRWIDKLFEAFEALASGPGIGHKRLPGLPEYLRRPYGGHSRSVQGSARLMF